MLAEVLLVFPRGIAERTLGAARGGSGVLETIVLGGILAVCVAGTMVCVGHTLRGCPGRRAMIVAEELSSLWEEQSELQDARQQRMSDAANRLTRAASQIGRKRGGAVAEPGQQPHGNGQPVQPTDFDAAALAQADAMLVRGFFHEET